jgi:hypothetical protein
MLALHASAAKGVETREEGQRPIKGEAYEADAYPPSGVRCGHISSPFPFGPLVPYWSYEQPTG